MKCESRLLEAQDHETHAHDDETHAHDDETEARENTCRSQGRHHDGTVSLRANSGGTREHGDNPSAKRARTMSWR